ncbi:MAG TPA: hypothetical protein VFT22_39150 [Kofleriaceae bacterium]|nr:hypothetical protein [Kofleriaceae bacterium]
MPAHHDDDLPTLDLADLAGVTGGAADAMSSMLPIMLMMRGRAQAAAQAAPPPAPAPWKPKILVDGVEQPVTASGNGTTFTSST